MGSFRFVLASFSASFIDSKGPLSFVLQNFRISFFGFPCRSSKRSPDFRFPSLVSLPSPGRSPLSFQAFWLRTAIALSRPDDRVTPILPKVSDCRHGRMLPAGVAARGEPWDQVSAGDFASRDARTLRRPKSANDAATANECSCTGDAPDALVETELSADRNPGAAQSGDQSLNRPMA